ncbi:EF0163 family protein [Enterococcus cecorum]|uniref:EF0163 family protein n=1 Tax=Enterococcus cecorum TaxID=44008 RepID=UPI002ACADE6C|nr:EF0163 family protein [Enterococcus cecorum]MDZ5584673.1 EF0163 family protein [Enterococcus cecorum]
MKKILTVISILMFGLVLGGVSSYFYAKSTIRAPTSTLKVKSSSSSKEEKETFVAPSESSENMQETKEQSNAQVSALEEQIRRMKDEEKQQKDRQRQAYQLIEQFGEKWLNYKSVYQRNQSVRMFLTDKAIGENGIDVDPHVEEPTDGEIYQIAQNLKNEKQWLLFGRERSKGGDNFILIVLGLDDTFQQIDQMKISYVRTAY